MKADITDKRIITLQNSEAACLGTAILAGVGTGLFSSIHSAAEKLAQTDCEYIPNLDRHEQYKKVFEAYMEIYQKLKGTFSKY
jgi:xylulokinase